MKKYLIFGILLVSFLGRLAAQEVKFEGAASSPVETGEQFRLIYTLNADGSYFIAPPVQNFAVIAGPSESSSSSVQYINGHVMQSASMSFSFILQAVKPGTYTLPAASIVVNGKKLLSNTVTIKVVKGSGNSSQGNSKNMSEAGASLSGNDVFLKAILSNSNPLQGEQITITYNLYTRLPVSMSGIDKIPSYQGFWSQDLLKGKDKFHQTTEVINGQKYMVAEIRKVALFPQKSGKLVIDPLEVSIVAQLQKKAKHSTSNDPFFDNFFNDAFSGPSVQNVQKTLRSNAIAINVRSLPTQNRPVDFNGAVGSFSFTPTIDRTTLKANEALTLRFTVSGRGNLNLIENPVVVFPPDFEAYDPKIIDNISSSESGVSGSRTFEYLLIPRNPGTYTIKSASFSYFDIGRNNYVRLQSPKYTINVLRGENNDPLAPKTGKDQEDIKYLGNDIRYINIGPVHLSKQSDFFFGSYLFYLLLFLPALLFAIIALVWKDRMKKRADIAFMRNKKATGISIKRLRKAKSYLNAAQQESFYNEISLALWGYMSDKFNLRLSELSTESVRNALQLKQVNEEIINQFTETLHNCEFARFAPGDKSAIMEQIYSEALNIITKIEHELK